MAQGPVIKTDPVDVQVLRIGAFKPVEQLLSRDVDSSPALRRTTMIAAVVNLVLALMSVRRVFQFVS